MPISILNNNANLKDTSAKKYLKKYGGDNFLKKFNKKESIECISDKSVVCGCDDKPKHSKPRPRPPIPPTPPPAFDIIIKGGIILTMDDNFTCIHDGAILIKGDKIVQILNNQNNLPTAASVIDATNHIVMPGLINAHGHPPMSLLRGLADDLQLLTWLFQFIFPAEAANVNPDFVFWGTLLACAEMALTGTTTFADMYYFEDDIARATKQSGLRGVLGQTIIGDLGLENTGAFPFVAPDFLRDPEVAALLAKADPTKIPNDPFYRQAVALSIEKAFQYTEAFIQKWLGDPNVIPSVAPHAFYTTRPETIERSLRLAEKYKVPLQIHISETSNENVDIKTYYVDTPYPNPRFRLPRAVPLAQATGLLNPRTQVNFAHTVDLTQEEIELIAAGNPRVSMSHNPESNAKLASGIAPVKALLEAGALVSIGTDGPASNNNLDHFESLDWTAKLQKINRDDVGMVGDPVAVAAREVVFLATRGGAKAYGIDDKVGSLEVGKIADIITIDINHPSTTPIYNVYSHLVYIIKGHLVDNVIVNGKFVVRNKNLLTINLPEVYRQVEILKQKIIASLPNPPVLC